MTHRKLVKSGKVKCSVSLSSTPPPTVNIPSAPSSPVPAVPQLEGSVHWGAVGEFSGVQTPAGSPVEADRDSVIQLAPPVLPPRLSFPLIPPPRPPVLTSPAVVESVSGLLQDLKRCSGTDLLEQGIHTPRRLDTEAVARRLLVPQPLSQPPEWKIPIVSTVVQTASPWKM